MKFVVEKVSDDVRLLFDSTVVNADTDMKAAKKALESSEIRFKRVVRVTDKVNSLCRNENVEDFADIKVSNYNDKFNVAYFYLEGYFAGV